MLSKENIREINELEKSGINVVAISDSGKLDYPIQDSGKYPFCDSCSSFRLLPDPDPYDWFRNGDMKAVCLEINGVIEGSLERPSEWTNIKKPLYCPKLGRELSEDEKKIAEKMLKHAKNCME